MTPNIEKHSLDEYMSTIVSIRIHYSCFFSSPSIPEVDIEKRRDSYQAIVFGERLQLFQQRVREECGCGLGRKGRKKEETNHSSGRKSCGC
jgi:hypothetical protein